MISISNTQQAILAAPYHNAYLARVRSFIEAKLPQLAAELAEDGKALEKRVESGLAEAAALGIISEQEQVLYVVLAILYGPHFPSRKPWAREVVARHKASGRQSGLAQSLMDASVSTGGAGR